MFPPGRAGPGSAARPPPTHGRESAAAVTAAPGLAAAPAFWACAVAGEGKGRGGGGRTGLGGDSSDSAAAQPPPGRPSSWTGGDGEGRRAPHGSAGRGAGGVTARPARPPGLGRRDSCFQVCDSYKRSVPRWSEAYGVASGSRG